MAPWLKTLAQIAPEAATLFGGPLAGMAVGVLGKALGIDGATEDQIAAVVTGAKPEDLLKIKAANDELVLHLKELDVKLADLDVQDAASARSIFGQGKIIISVLAGIIVGSFLYMVWYMVHDHTPIPPAEATLIGTLIGYVSSKADQVVSYFFGSSHGSTQKNDMLADAFKKNGN
jgi:xanthosine utilization system XapX-like protein